jgi:hypothetical protein
MGRAEPADRHFWFKRLLHKPDARVLAEPHKRIWQILEDDSAIKIIDTWKYAGWPVAGSLDLVRRVGAERRFRAMLAAPTSGSEVRLAEAIKEKFEQIKRGATR